MENQKNKLHGLLLVDKCPGMTSHDVVDHIRSKLRIKKVGHAGTLDPLAEGLLILLIGRYTKFFPKFVNFDKEYLGILKLGETTTTGDSEGNALAKESIEHITNEKIQEAFVPFKGAIEQIPPMVSAIRIGGKRLYKLARKGMTVKRMPRKIRIYELDILKIDLPFVEFFVHCSKGTYIRKLAEDIGASLGCGAHIVKIKRLAIGPFKLKDALPLEEVNESNLKTHIPVQA